MPLVIPEGFDAFRMMTFDPGLSNTGCAAWNIASRDHRVLSVYAETLENIRLPNLRGWDDEVHNERTLRLMRLQQAVWDRLVYWNPQVAGCESPFFNRLFPGAYGVLSEVVLTIRETVRAYNPNIPFYMVEPQLVKKGLGVAGKKGKEVVSEALLKLPDIANVLSPPVEALDEHSVDATAVGNALLKYRLSV